MELILAVVMLVVLVAFWAILPSEKKVAASHAPSASPKIQQRA